MEKNKRNAKGQGSFILNEDGSVTHRKSVGYLPNGTRKILQVTATSRAACIKEMKKKEVKWNEQQELVKVGERTTVEELCYFHLQSQVEQGDLKAKSIDRREATIANQIHGTFIARMQILSVQTSDVENLFNRMVQAEELSASTIKKALDVLNAAYKWASGRWGINYNPVSPIKDTLSKRIQRLADKGAEDADVIVLSENEIISLERTALEIVSHTGKYRYPAGISALILLDTGMRCGELLALRWKDLNFETGLLKINKNRSMAKNRNKKEEEANYVMEEGTTKNEKARIIKLSDRALAWFRLLKSNNPDTNENELMVQTRSGRGNTTTNLEHTVNTIYKNAGISAEKTGLHILRRTCATQMYEKGARVEEIAAYIGDLESTTRKYYIAIRKQLEEQNVVVHPLAMRTSKQDVR